MPASIVNSRIKLHLLWKWFWDVTCHDSLYKAIFQGTLEGGQHRGRQRKCWMENTKEWTSLTMPDLLTQGLL